MIMTWLMTYADRRYGLVTFLRRRRRRKVYDADALTFVLTRGVVDVNVFINQITKLQKVNFAFYFLLHVKIFLVNLV